MILGEPDLQSIIDLIIEDGCPNCGESPDFLHVKDHDELLLKCGHVVDATKWIDGDELREVQE